MNTPKIKKLYIEDVQVSSPPVYDDQGSYLVPYLAASVISPVAASVVAASGVNQRSPMSDRTKYLLRNSNVNVQVLLKKKLADKLRQFNIVDVVGEDRDDYEISINITGYGLVASAIKNGAYPAIQFDYTIRDKKNKMNKRAGGLVESDTMLSLEQWELNKQDFSKEFDLLMEKTTNQIINELVSDSGYSNEGVF